MMHSASSGDSISPDVSPMTSYESPDEVEPIAVPENELATANPAGNITAVESEFSSQANISQAATKTCETPDGGIWDKDDQGFLEDEDDSESEEGTVEVFADEPEETTKKGKGFRTKVPFTTAKAAAGALSPNHRKKNSYWSSDEDTIQDPFQLARPKKKQPPGESNPVAPMPPSAEPAVPPVVERVSGKAKNKRRLRRPADEHLDHSENSSSVEEMHAAPKPTKLSQRLAPPVLDPPIQSNGPNNEGLPDQVEVLPTGGGKPSSSSKKKRQATAAAAPPLKQVPLHLSIEDMEICQRLDDEYENALEEREIGYMARYTSVRQSACFSVGFMLFFLFVGTYFFMKYSDWSVHDSLLFSIYTITTVGYGYHDIPATWGFQIYVILYIFVGIATLTIMVAQVYQCIALEASRAQHSRDKSEMQRRGLDVLTPRDILLQQRHNNNAQSSQASTNSSANSYTNHDDALFLEDFLFYETFMQYYEKAKIFFTYNEYGRSLSVLFPFAGLILIGAMVVGPIEGWSLIESLYFAVVSLTTVGFGDYYPKHVASIWFCILWLPFSVGFMSMFLKNVATFYIRLSAKNINRIEKRMRKRLARAKEHAEQERAEALKRAYRGQEAAMARFPSSSSADGAIGSSKSPERRHDDAELGKVVHTPPRSLQYRNFESLPTNGEDTESNAPVVRPSRSNLFGSQEDDSGINNRRERILQNSLEGTRDDTHRRSGQTMDTMKDVIQAVHNTLDTGSKSEYLSFRSSVVNLPLGGHSTGASTTIRKPSFALRCLVQERFAMIIATDIAGYQSSIEIRENTLSVTIESLKDTADKWYVPRRARKAFRAVAFEALYFVGEHGLITTGADALFALTPFEFHGLFSPLLAAMGDADTMESWLARTKVLAQVDLQNRDSKEAIDSEPVLDGVDETGSLRSSGRSKADRLRTATNKLRSDGSDSIDWDHAADEFE